jgi:hypothetical protein
MVLRHNYFQVSLLTWFSSNDPNLRVQQRMGLVSHPNRLVRLQHTICEMFTGWQQLHRESAHGQGF